MPSNHATSCNRAVFSAKPINYTCYIISMIITIVFTSSSAAQIPCFTATPTTLNSTSRHTGVSSESLVFSFTEPGIFIAEASTSAPSQDLPTVNLLAHACTPLGSFVPIYQTPTEIAIRIMGASNLYLSVTPATSVTSFKLRNTFASDPQGTPDLITPSTEPPSSCTATSLPEVNMLTGTTRTAEVEDTTDPWDCDVIMGNFPSGIILLEANGVPVDASIYAEGSCSYQLATGLLMGSGTILGAPVLSGEHRLMLGPVDLAGAYTLHVEHFETCLLGEQDDHSDSALCATALSPGVSAQGNLDNTSGDDEDLFYFRLAAQETVQVDLQGGTNLYCVLLDESGERLSTSDDCGWAQSKTLSKTLDSGLYRIKVSGTGQQNDSYSLDLTLASGP